MMKKYTIKSRQCAKPIEYEYNFYYLLLKRYWESLWFYICFIYLCAIMERIKTTRKQLTMWEITILIARLLVWAMLISYWFGKLLWGVETRERLWSNMSMLGISEWFVIWWFLAMFAEFFCGIFLIFGLFTRVSSFLVSFTFVIVLLVQGKRVWADPTTIIEMVKFIEIVFYLYASIFFLSQGWGKLSMDRRFWLCLIDKYCKI